MRADRCAYQKNDDYKEMVKAGISRKQTDEVCLNTDRKMTTLPTAFQQGTRLCSNLVNLSLSMRLDRIRQRQKIEM
jgi:hypothetical protein